MHRKAWIFVVVRNRNVISLHAAIIVCSLVVMTSIASSDCNKPFRFVHCLFSRRSRPSAFAINIHDKILQKLLRCTIIIQWRCLHVIKIDPNNRSLICQNDNPKVREFEEERSGNAIF